MPLEFDLNVTPPPSEFSDEENEEASRYPSSSLVMDYNRAHSMYPSSTMVIDYNRAPINHSNNENRVPSMHPSSSMTNLYEEEQDSSEDELVPLMYNSDVNDEESGETLSQEEGNIAHETQSCVKKRSFLDNNQRKMISELLIHSSYNGKLKGGIVKMLASLFLVSRDVIYRIWRQLRQTGDVCHKKTKNCGRKRVGIDIEKMRDVPFAKRSNLLSLACALGICKTSLLRYLREGVLRRHSNALKPYLKDDNMKARLRFCLSMIEENSIPHDPKFKSMHNVVHIDEKWFYISKKNTKYYLHASEDDPYRTCKNKNYITKVMFLVAVARPRFDDEGNETFSGKIGLFPLVNKIPAKRSSVNRASGTLETKPIASINKEVSRMFLIDKILPAIKEKWPREHASETIYIQQDNAPCHVSVDDEEFCRVASEGGFDIRLICQPPNSPDLNVLDLGFFSAIQSLQQMEVTNSVDELIQTVQNSYDNFSSKASNKIFLTLQSCMIEIMKIKGSNNYKIPHLKKDKMFNQGKLPTELKCDRELVLQTFEYLHNVD